MRFDSRDLTAKLMADAQGGGCGRCTQRTDQPPNCNHCTDTDHGNCPDCSLTEEHETDHCQQREDSPDRRKHSALMALRQQLRETLSQPG